MGYLVGEIILTPDPSSIGKEIEKSVESDNVVAGQKTRMFTNQEGYRRGNRFGRFRRLS